MPHRANKKRRLTRARHSSAADRRDNRGSPRASLNTTRGMSPGSRKFLSEPAKRRAAKRHPPIRSTRNGAIRNPKTELEAATQRFVDLYDFAPIAYVSFGRAGRIEEANLMAAELLDEPRDRLIGRPFAFYVADLDLFMLHLLSCRTSQRQVKTELQLKTRKGELIPAQLLSTPITSTTRNGALLFQTAIIDLGERKRHEQQLAEQARLLDLSNDVTRRKQMEIALQESKKLLEERVRERTRDLRMANKELLDEIARRKGLEGEILEISDREQQRLGQEIHDGLCQHLTAVAFMARSVALRLKNHRVIDAGDIEKIAQLVNDAATDTRNLSRALHRIDVDSAGFITALEDLVDREIWRIPCRLEVKPSFHIEDDVAAGELYRIAREAVINANKHSEAREIVIKLERTRSEMVLRVIDDGVGFSSNPKAKRGLGAHIMGYRARLMGARLEIDSPKRGGTRVSCYLPDRRLQPKERKNNRTQPFPARIVKALATLI